MMHITDNEELLVDYLYEEGDAAERLRVARHLQECAPCSVAVLELQSVREILGGWKPPAARLGFKIVPAADEAPPERASRFGRLGAGWPMWAQGAAALLLFAAGMGVSQLQFEYGGGALTVRSRSAAPAPVTAEAVMHGGNNITLPASASDSPVASESVAYSPSRSASADELLRRVQALIDRSESRQQRQLALRLADVVRDFDTQRQADMLQVQQNLGQLEGQTGAEVAQQRALLNSLVKVSQGGSK